MTNIDLVAWQLHVAQGGVLPFLEPLKPRGHAIEARVYAEDPATKFMPSPGRITYLRVPSGPYVRDDSGVYAGYTVPNVYDPMISKLSVWAPTRAEAILRMRRALGEYVVKGITTNVHYLRRIMEHPDFQSGDYDTGFLGRAHEALVSGGGAELERAAMVAAAVYAYQAAEKKQAEVPPTTAQAGRSGWRAATGWRHR